MGQLKSILLWITLVFSYHFYAQNPQEKKTHLDEPMFLGVTGNIGIGLVRDKLSPLIKIDLRLIQPNDYKLRLGTQINYFFESNGNFKTYISPFINAEFLKFNKKTNNSWQGIGLGYLIKDNSSYLGDNSIRLSLIHSLNKIEMRGDLFFTDSFKQVFPGLTVVINFL